MSRGHFLLYGAYGYTGALIAAQARDHGLTPILAGRRAGPLLALAARTGAQHRVFALDSHAATVRQLADCKVVLNCAGPFADTARPMIAACMDSASHYLDVSGEIDVFEHAQSCAAAARDAGILICPGVGFDVVPTDCLALTLKHALPDATNLELAFDMPGGLSPGTAKTMLRGLAQGGRARCGGRIQSVPLAWRTREIDFGQGLRHAVSIPWGDVATAFYTTGIGNITTYVPLSPQKTRQLRRLNYLRPLLKLDMLQRFAARRIEHRVRGPDTAARDAADGRIWGEVRNAAGDIRTARMQTANGYSVTAAAALRIVAHILATPPRPGASTPAQLMGSDFATQLPGSSTISLS